jgi:hypothetical protein
MDQTARVNQYTTQCLVISVIDGFTTNNGIFSDLQMAYLHAKTLASLADRNWDIKPWESTISLLYEYYTEDGSGIDVAKSMRGDRISIFYQPSLAS